MKIINTVLLIVFLFASVPYAEASTADVDDELRQQLMAIVEYLGELLPVDSMSLSPEEMKSVITDGAGWIVASQEESGHFGYEYAPYGGEYDHSDNIVRQAGTLYVLAEVYRAQAKNEKDEKIAAAIESSIEYFAGLTKKADSAGSCVQNSQDSRNCQLGATALALLGVLSYVEAEPDQRERYDNTITDYSDFLLASRLAEKGFSENYNFSGGFKEVESSFFNGEALLALVHYYQYEPREEVRTTIDDVFTYLKVKEYDPNLYLWIMGALKDMQALWPSTEYVQYVQDFTNWRMNRSALYRQTTHNYCAYTEGLASAYSVLEGNVPVETERKVFDELNYWLNKNARLQVDATNLYRIFANDTGLKLVKLTDKQRANGGFLTGTNELTQRIDFTQHCVSSFLQKFEDIDELKL